jgi:mannose-6-phosphate isomerase-like protein (cupin superfamily)
MLLATNNRNEPVAALPSRSPAHSALVGLLALLFLAVASLGNAEASGAVERIVLGTTYPENSPGQHLIISRVIVPPGAKLSPHFHEGTQFARISSGVLTYRILSGTAELTDARGRISYPTGPTVVYLRKGDSLVENEGLAHAAENRGRIPVVIELSTLLRNGANPSTPLGEGEPPTLVINADLTSEGTALNSAEGEVLYGWNRLVGPGDNALYVDMQGSVSYVQGSGGFGGFVTFTFADGATIGTRVNGAATEENGNTDFAATLVVLGGTGRFATIKGSGTFVGSRIGDVGSPVDSSFELYLE